MSDLEKLLAEATPAPWTNLSMTGEPIESVWTDKGVVALAEVERPAFSFSATQARKDAALIAALRNLVPELIAVVKAVAALPGDNCNEHGEWVTPCGICGRKVFSPNVKHANDCAWLAARRLANG